MTPPNKKVPGLGGGQACTSNGFNSHSTIEAALSEALATRGVTGILICADGNIHRFDAPDKRRGNLNGWYVCPAREVAVFGFWHTGERETVTLNGLHDPAAAAAARWEAQRNWERRDRERRELAARAATKAKRWWHQAHLADPCHPYLAKKHLPPYGLRQRENTLLLPLFHAGELVNLEQIFPDGSKRSLTDGHVKGVASLIGRPAGAKCVLVSEGWATCAALYESTSCPVVVARNADNLEPVSRRLRQRLPVDVAITIAGDDDRHLVPNKGRLAARHAARIIGAKLLMPSFCDGCETCTDFDDVRLCRLGGARHD